MNDHTNATLMQRGYDAFASGDLDTLTELIAPDAVWHQPGHNSIAGDYVGRDAIFDYFGKLLTLTDGTFKAEVVDIVADDDRAIAIQHSTGTRNGQKYDTKNVVVFEMRDGRFVETQVYESDPELEDRFWAN